MTGKATTFNTAPEELLEILNGHLPWSLTLLRRLQFAKNEAGTTPDARILLSSDINGLGDSSKRPAKFTVAYLDLSAGPATQLFVYSTLQDGRPANEEETEYRRQLAILIEEIIQLRKNYGRKEAFPGCVLLGSFDSRVRRLVESTGRIDPRPPGDYEKWLINAKNLPVDEAPLPEGMEWGRATLEDCRLVVARSEVPRRAEEMMALPNVFVKLGDQTPVAWAFLGVDASLSSLACEEPYRRRGLSKKLITKLFRECMGAFGDDGICSADVSLTNVASRALCESLGGWKGWVVSWILLNVEEGVHDA